MLKEFLDRLLEVSRENVELGLLYETSRERVYEDNGKIVHLKREIPPRRHTILSIPSLVSALRRYKAEDASVWVSEKKIVVCLNDAFEEYRDNEMVMALQPSPFFEVLRSAKWLNQTQFIDMLRHDLAGAGISPDNTLALVRNLKFTATSETTGKVDNNSAAMGKSVTAEITGQDKLPETVMVEFAPYPALRDLLDGEVKIDCTLFTDVVTEKLRLAPRPGEIEAAIIKAMELVQAKLQLDVAPIDVFLGLPETR